MQISFVPTVIQTGIVSLLTAFVSGYFVYRQGVKTSERSAKAAENTAFTTAQTALASKRLEVDAQFQNHWHDDYVAERNRANDLAKQLGEAQRAQFKCEAELDSAMTAAKDAHSEIEELQKQLRDAK